MNSQITISDDTLKVIQTLNSYGVLFSFAEEKTKYEKEEDVLYAVANLNGVNFFKLLPDLKEIKNKIRKKGLLEAIDINRVYEEKTQKIINETIELCDALGFKDNSIYI
ncbi:MAG: hypothetical protein GQ532_08020 [Methylomarinum sp.]|nr:hypothetical protein [Methylomarinum sp.]